MTFQSENVDLTNLLSVRDLSRKLLNSDLTKIDAIVCNAGIGGWAGLNWPQAVRDNILDIRNNTTWPEYKLGTVGSLTKPQLPAMNTSRISEPPLGEIFCANVFGHYMLIHWLMPLFRACDASSPAKILWVSSVEPQDYHFKENDLQGLHTSAPYEHGKRLTDILSLTSNQTASAEAVSSFTSSNPALSTQKKRPDNGPPKMHLYHPGILCTTVIALPPVIYQAYVAAIYIARFVGANWSNVQPYTAADGVTWLLLSSEDQIRKAEIEVQPLSSTPVVKQGKVKWGTSSSPLGTTTVRPTEVAGWGITGSGQPYASTWWGGLYGSGGKYGRGRKPGAVEATGQDVKEFVALGGRVWSEMEKTRQEWEKRIAESGL